MGRILRILSIRYSRYVGSFPVGIGRKMVVVGGWGGQMLWEAEVLEDSYGAKAESYLKLKILRLIMNRKTCCNCKYKLVLVSTNENKCWEGIK